MQRCKLCGKFISPMDSVISVGEDHICIWCVCSGPPATITTIGIVREVDKWWPTPSFPPVMLPTGRARLEVRRSCGVKVTGMKEYLRSFVRGYRTIDGELHRVES